MLDDVDFLHDPYSCARRRDALVIVTEWEAFRALDLDRIKSVLRRRSWSICAISTTRPKWRGRHFNIRASAEDSREAARRGALEYQVA